MTPLFAVLAAFAVSEVTVTTHLEPPVIPYHQQARYTVAVETTKELKVKLPDMVDLFSGLAVYGTPEYRQEPLDDGRIRITETYTLDAIQPRIYEIAPAVVTWEGGRVEVVSPALRVRELTPEEEEAAANFNADIATPDLSTPEVWTRWPFWAIAGGVAAVALAIALWSRRERKAAPAPIPKKPWEIAYERLRMLDERHYPDQGAYQPYYVDLSSILRYYIEDRFHIHAPEQTTQEFLNEVTGRDALTENQQRMLGQFLRHCDRVKFAQYQPSKQEMEESFTRVLEFVDETVPKPAAVGREAA